MTPEEIATAKTQMSAAHQLVGGLCDGTEQWRMSIPANPKRDSDLILSDALNAGGMALAEIDRLNAELIEARLAAEEAWDAHDEKGTR